MLKKKKTFKCQMNNREVWFSYETWQHYNNIFNTIEV